MATLSIRLNKFGRHINHLMVRKRGKLRLDDRAASDPPYSNANFTDIVDKAIAGAAGAAKLLSASFTLLYFATNREFG
jgi:hypothetical protein